MKTLQIDEQTEKDLKSLRNYIGKRQKTREDHMYYSLLTMLVNKLKKDRDIDKKELKPSDIGVVVEKLRLWRRN